jgi:hypothetical protein
MLALERSVHLDNTTNLFSFDAGLYWDIVVSGFPVPTTTTRRRNIPGEPE